MSDNGVPGLTSRTVEELLGAGEALAQQVRTKIPHSPRPVFLHYIEQTFDALRTKLSRGLDPHPDTPAQQLCLYLMVAYAERRIGSLDADLIRIHHALLADDDALAEVCRVGGDPGQSYDFVALGDALTGRGMSAFFAPLEPDDLVA
ncbi:hypothetical protein [Nocardia pseudovaccinii]|uniref:hypothetical protein n=1 Tax=Nocardia pseudovaccinii TaxID=189540 RepID=UPI0007A3739F|nr:hypothetical protein [Nocardia pseudovaccinii]